MKRDHKIRCAKRTLRKMEFKKSAELLERSKKVIPGGITSNVRANWSPHPLFYSHGEGSRVWDVDGNEYIDYVLARGPLLMGHSPHAVLDAAKAQMDIGLMYAGQSELEVEVAERIQKIVPCAERVRFSVSGSEAVHAALRLARSVTGKKKIVRFEGHYHGWFDNIMWNFAPPLDQAGPRESPNLVRATEGQQSEDGANLIVLPWNDLDLVEDLFLTRGDEIAGVITEPIMCNYGAIQPLPGYLEGLRRITQEHGALLIFDEVITGFRVALGGAQELFGVTPDLATFAKAMGAGTLVSAVAGKAKYMDSFGTLETMHAGTYNAAPYCMAAVKTALDLLSENSGALLAKTHSTAYALMQGLEEIAKESSLPMAIRGVPPVFHLSFLPEGSQPVVDYRTVLQSDAPLMRKFWIALQERGIRITPEGLCFVSTAHTEKDVEETLAAVKDALAAVA